MTRGWVDPARMRPRDARPTFLDQLRGDGFANADLAAIAGLPVALVDALYPQPDPSCTGRTATWCPTHGDCVCPRLESGDFLSMDDPGCPLHNPDSPHPANPEDEESAVEQQDERPDAYEYLGRIEAHHPAVDLGLTATSTDADIDAIAARLLADPEPCPFDPATLGPALATWRDDLQFFADDAAAAAQEVQ